MALTPASWISLGVPTSAGTRPVSLDDLRLELGTFHTKTLSPMLQQLFFEQSKLIMTSFRHEFDQHSAGLSSKEEHFRSNGPVPSTKGALKKVCIGPVDEDVLYDSEAQSFQSDPENSSTPFVDLKPSSTAESTRCGRKSQVFKPFNQQSRQIDPDKTSGLPVDLKPASSAENVRSIRKSQVFMPFLLRQVSDSDSEVVDEFEVPDEASLSEVAKPNGRGRRGVSRYSPLQGNDDPRNLILAPVEDSTRTGKLTTTPRVGSSSSLLWFVNSSRFESLGGALVLLSAFFTGVETDYLAWRGHQIIQPPLFFDIMEFVFTAAFTLELTLRIYAFGRRFFSGLEWQWNIFDCFVVACQLASSISRMGGQIKIDLSVVRLIRILRLIRLFRYFDELSTLVSSIYFSLRSLIWTLLLLLLLVYGFSILFTQVVWNALAQGAQDAERLEYWFGCLARTALTLFESIAGGVSWDVIAHLLIVDISPFMCILYCVYISLCVFALLNVVTGVFLEKATKIAHEGLEEAAAKQVGDLVKANPAEEVTCDQFTEMLKAEDMQEFFKVVNVDPSESQSLFQLLDVDDSGTLEPQEVVSGLLRLRGNAKALELFSLIRSVHQLHRDVTAHQTSLSLELANLRQSIKHCKLYE